MKNNSAPACARPPASAVVDNLLDWFSVNARDLPWRRTRDPYAIWISEVMLQQTQVNTVVPYWNRWMRELPTIAALAVAHPDHLHKLWEGLGYYTRVRNLQRAAQQIVQSHGGRFPTRFKDVLTLPGIGRYTAGAICSIAFNQPAAILDGNVIRVLTRLFGISGNPRETRTNEKLWKLAGDLVTCAARNQRLAPERFKAGSTSNDLQCCGALNESLMELGALVCTSRQPDCAHCPLARNCLALRKHQVDKLPNLGPCTNMTRRKFAAFVVERNGRVLVRRRPEGIVNAHLWEFPNIELAGPASDPIDAASRSLAFVPKKLDPICQIRHSITRYRITLAAYWAIGLPASALSRVEGSWIEFNQLNGLAFPSAHRKILNLLRSPAKKVGRSCLPAKHAK